MWAEEPALGEIIQEAHRRLLGLFGLFPKIIVQSILTVLVMRGVILVAEHPPSLSFVGFEEAGQLGAW